jgi:hypothetical protein
MWMSWRLLFWAAIVSGVTMKARTPSIVVLDLDLQPLHHAGHVLDQRRRAGVGHRLPFLAGLGAEIPVGP